MTGIPDFNYPAFFSEAARLRALGHSVNNPAEFGAQSADAWEDYLRRDIVALMDCQTIHMLPGWTKSKGARLERYIASQLGFTITGADA